MTKKVPRIQFESFKPFATRNIRKDGREVYVHDRAQLRALMRENHLVEHPYNDSMESRCDPREIKAAAAEEKKAFPAKYRKLKEEVKIMTKEQVKPLAVRAHATEFGTRP